MAAEEGDTREPVTKEVRLLVPIEKSADRPKRISYGVVLEPDTEDLQGDVMTAEDIEAAAYDWMERSQAGGHMHTATVEGAKVVESYIAPCDIPMETAHGRETIRKGSWVLAMRWPEDIWESIAKGDLTGYSVGGTGVRLALEEIGKKGKWAPGPNAGWRLADGEVYRGDPAAAGAAAEGGGTPADQGDAAARRETSPFTAEFPEGFPASEDLPEGWHAMSPFGKQSQYGQYGNGPHSVFHAGTPYAEWMKAGGFNTDAPPNKPWIHTDGRDVEISTFHATPQEAMEEASRYDAMLADVTPERFQPGDKVKDRFGGEIKTVRDHPTPLQVFLEEDGTGNTRWHHPGNLTRVKKDAVESGLEEVVREGLLEAVDKHAQHDQSTHGNWARGGGMRTADYGEFISGDRVKLVSNETIDWGGLEGATGRIVDVNPGTLGWPAIYSVKLDREWVGWEDDDTLHDLEANGLAMLRRVRKDGSPSEKVAKDKGWAPGPNAGWRRRSGEDLTGYHSDKSTPRLAAWHRSQTASTPEERRQAAEEYERLADAEDAAMAGGGGKKHTTRDGVVVEDQPKVTRVGGEQYQIAKPEGQVILNFGEWKWTGTGKSPKVTERGSWAVWPRHKKHNLDNLIRSSDRTLAELMRDLLPGEYDLAP